MQTIEQGNISRTGRGQPIVAGVIYPRVTTLTGRAEDKSGLLNYMLSTGVEGVFNSPELQAAWAVLDKTDFKAKRALLDKIKTNAGADAKAQIGTAIHSVTESLDRGENLDGFPDTLVQDALAYRNQVNRLHLTPIVAELFVVNEELGTAGTLDRIFQGPSGQFYVGDLKTSAREDSAKWSLSSWSTQVAVYANSKPVMDNQIVEWSDIGIPALSAPDLTSGIVIHVAQGKAIGKAYRVDLNQGFERAKAAAFLYKQDKIFNKILKSSEL